MDITHTKAIAGFIRMCDDGWRLGWHERNGGNLTYRMTKEDICSCQSAFATDRPWVSMGVSADNLAKTHFLTTGSGKYFRNVALAPQENIGIVEINDAGDAYRIVWGLENGAQPTSEFPSHFLNHSVRAAVTGGQCRVIYHAHTTAIIALTYVLELDAGVFTRALWRSATECPVVFPDGVGVVPWMVPGGAAIAKATSQIMRRHSAAVWAHHGLFCSGPDFDTTFGLMHTIEKAAEIHLKVLSSGLPMRQSITDDDLRAIAVDFNVQLNEDMLG